MGLCARQVNDTKLETLRARMILLMILKTAVGAEF